MTAQADAGDLHAALEIVHAAMAPTPQYCWPLLLETGRQRTLTINDAVKDYDAVMTSEAHLRNVHYPLRLVASGDVGMSDLTPL